jgi:hypothetical protein
LNVPTHLRRRLESQCQRGVRRQEAKRRFTASATIHDFIEARKAGPGEERCDRVTAVVLRVIFHGPDEPPNIHGELGRCLIEPVVQPSFGC